MARVVCERRIGSIAAVSDRISEIGHSRQPVRRIRGDRRHGDPDQRRRRHQPAASSARRCPGSAGATFPNSPPACNSPPKAKAWPARRRCCWLPANAEHAQGTSAADEGGAAGGDAEARRDHPAWRRQGGDRGAGGHAEEHRRHHPQPRRRGAGTARSRAASTTSSTMRCAARRTASSPSPRRRCWTPRPSMNAVLASANLSQDDATEAGRTIEQLGNVIASSNLIASNLMAALSARNADALEPVETELQGRPAIGEDRASTHCPPPARPPPRSRQAALKLLALGDGKTGIFKMRQKELDALRLRRADPRRDPQAQCRPRHQRQAAGGQRPRRYRSRREARRVEQIALATQVMLGLGALTLIGSALFVWLYVGRSILRRIGNLQRSMQALSAGEPRDRDRARQQRRTRSRQMARVAGSVPRQA